MGGGGGLKRSGVLIALDSLRRHVKAEPVTDGMDVKLEFCHFTQTYKELILLITL